MRSLILCAFLLATASIADAHHNGNFNGRRVGGHVGVGVGYGNFGGFRGVGFGYRTVGVPFGVVGVPTYGGATFFGAPTGSCGNALLGVGY